MNRVISYVDADFAGCRVSRKSTGGGCLVWAGGTMKSWTKTLPTLALSTGEAELGAIVRGVTEADGVVAILKDFGFSPTITLKSDASAAIGIVQRLGLGRVRHLAVSDLWVQQRMRSKDMDIEKVNGLENPADLLTKSMDRARSAKLTTLLNLHLPLDMEQTWDEPLKTTAPLSHVCLDDWW